MASINSTYTGDLRTVSLHEKSGIGLTTDAPTDNQGKGEAFSPTDLLATSLGTCMLTIMGIAARNSGYSIDGTAIQITKTMASNPRRIAAVHVQFTMPPQEYSDKQKKQLYIAATDCPVALSLHPDVKQTVEFDWN